MLSFLVAIALVLVISIFPITGNIRFLTVLSGSMDPAIKTGSVVMIKPVKEYKIGEVVTFITNTKNQQSVTHRIHDMKVEGGEVIYITKGDANNAPDQRELKKKDIIGKVLFSIPFFGYAVDFAKKPIGFALIIIIPTIAIISEEIIKIYNEIKKKKKNEN